MQRIAKTLVAVGLSTLALNVHAQEEKQVDIATLNWAENIAAANMWKLVLEQEPYNYQVKITNVGKSVAFSGIASGDMDISLEVWLPTTDKEYVEPYKDRLTIHDAWYEGPSLGLVVPSYVEIDSIPELTAHAENFNYQGKPTIVGIDPGSTISTATEDAIETYDLPMQQLSSSEVAMMAAFKDAYKRQEPMVVTLWNPHWAFAEYDLKYLDDPENVYGAEEETIYWFSRKGFADDDPWLTAVLNAWEMDDDSLGGLMATIEKSGDPVEGAQQWIEENREQVDGWLAAGDSVN